MNTYTFQSDRIIYSSGGIAEEFGLLGLADTLGGFRNPHTGLLPIAIRWISRRGTTFLVERPPDTMTIRWTPELAIKAETEGSFRSREIRINVPWQHYFVRFSDPMLNAAPVVSMSFAYEPLNSLDNLRLYTCLPNTSRYDVCLGAKFPQQYAAAMAQLRMSDRWNLPAALSFVLNSFWENGFNQDMYLSPNQLPEEAGECRNHGEWLTFWEKASLEEVLSWHWHGNGRHSAFCGTFDNPVDSKSVLGFLCSLRGG